MYIHNLIGRHDNIRKCLLSDQNSRQRTAEGGRQGITHIFGGNGKLTVSQRLQCSNLGPLFLDHTGHGCQADQSRHHKEEYREHFADGPHPVCIIRISAVIRRTVPVIDIPVRLINACDFIFCIQYLNFRIRNLFFRFFLPFFIFFPAICQLLLILRNGAIGFSNLCFTALYLAPSVCISPLTAGQLIIGIRQYSLTFFQPGFLLFKLRPARFKLLSGCRQFFLPARQFRFSGFQRLPAHLPGQWPPGPQGASLP